jgi:Tfp pilus assembly protein PilN
MLRTNLSTRPFYNERLVHLALGLAALVVLAVTALNLVEVVRLSRENTKLSARIREDRAAADEFVRKARSTRQNINQDELKLVVAAAREANTLIDSRTFSWTQFFNYIESTLPPEVMLASVRPTIEDNGTRVTMVVLARRPEDLEEFMNKLEATGAFEKVLSRQTVPNEEGLREASVEALYVPEPPSPPVVSPKPAASTGPSASPAPATQPASAPAGKGGSR